MYFSTLEYYHNHQIMRNLKNQLYHFHLRYIIICAHAHAHMRMILKLSLELSGLKSLRIVYKRLYSNANN